MKIPGKKACEKKPSFWTNNMFLWIFRAFCAILNRNMKWYQRTVCMVSGGTLQNGALWKIQRSR